jgi:DNA helicase-2/ATP-dependent DNA helicase PcrA
MPMTITNRVAGRYAHKIAEETDMIEESLPDQTTKEIPLERVLDLMNFAIALQAYKTVLATQGKDSNKDPLIRKSVSTIRTYGTGLQSGMQQHFGNLADRSDFSPLRPTYLISQRSGNPIANFEKQADFAKALMPWLKLRSGVFNSVFLTGKQTKTAREIANVAQEESPLSALNKAALIPCISGLWATRKWMTSAAEFAGVPVKPIENEIVETTMAKSLGEDLNAVENELENTNPNSPEAAQLQEKRLRVLDQVTELKNDATNPSAIVPAVVSAKPASNQQKHPSVGKKPTPEQEAAMIVQNKAIIAAGAGSGKTFVLASKVVLHMTEGIDPANIIATSFTRKASAELLTRIKDFGGVIDGRNVSNFGTTHSIAAHLLTDAPEYKRNYAGNENGVGSKKTGWKLKHLLRLAMEQVQMGNPEKYPDPKPVGFWSADDVDIHNTAPVLQTPVSTPTNTPATTNIPNFQEAIIQAHNFYSSSSYWRNNSWVQNFVLPFLESMRRVQDPSRLSDKQKNALDKILLKVKPIINFHLAAEAKKQSMGLDEYHFYTHPAEKWFNIGAVLVDEKADVRLTMGGFQQAISILKGRGLTPAEAWMYGSEQFEAKSIEAAVYGAYEWLKGPEGEPSLIGTGDMDDMLIDAVTALVKNTRLRNAVQAKYKIILVDEAQDLNAVQHKFFGLMSGSLDPKTLQEWPDGHMTANTYAMIGDDKQCPHADTFIDTPTGKKQVKELQIGDTILSYRNGHNAFQKIKQLTPSNWTWGFQITTETGQSLTISPNHRLWATEPQTKDGQVAVYLMYHKDMGYRVGITNKGKIGSEDDYYNSYGGRCFLEKAERLWILEICATREEALLKETQYSLRYSVPTAVFNGKHRDINQMRLDALFKEFGANGQNILNDKLLSFNYPHWMSQSYTKHGRERHTINLLAHTSSGTQVAMEWSGDKFDTLLENCGVQKTSEDRRRLRRWFNNYQEGLAFAERIAILTGANLSHKLSTPENPIREMSASSLFVGMKVPVKDGESIVLETIVEIKKVDGQFIDLEVYDASNFFGNNILSHNSIYAFRGADPEEFMSKSDLLETDGKKGSFKTKLLDTNFRSGSKIVDSAGMLISHNKRQVPMVCKAAPHTGKGEISIRSAFDTEHAAISVAEDIQTSAENMIDIPKRGKYSSFGIAVRSNKEAYEYGLELLKRQIPFKTNINFFNDTTTRALIGWLNIIEHKTNGSKDLMINSIEDAAKAPVSRLGRVFIEKMESLNNPIEYLITTDPADIAYKIYKKDGPNQVKQMKTFTDNIKYVMGLTGTPEGILNKILSMTGLDGKTLQESLTDRIMDDDEVMKELQIEAEGQKVTIEQIQEKALSPLKPLIGLLANKENINEAMAFIRKLQNVNTKIASKDTEHEIDKDAVTIGTIHSWKGLESNTMFVPFVGGKFPRTGAEGVAPEGRDLWAERRLAYVAITRAEQRCVLIDIPNPKFKTHSQFLDETCIPREGKPTNEQSGKTASELNEWSDERITHMMLLMPEDF